MDLTSRISLTGPPAESPEDFLSSALSTLYPEDASNMHGDAQHGLVYTSPHLPAPIRLDLADPEGDVDRSLFSHYLWNASLLLAELVEAGTLRLDVPGTGPLTLAPPPPPSPRGQDALVTETTAMPTPKPTAAFDVTGLSVLELGSGTALPSLLAALLGARRVVVTDYPAPAVMETLKKNVARNVPPTSTSALVHVDGHVWGDVAPQTSTSSSLSPYPSPLTHPSNHHAFDRVLAADCLWMPWQHTSLRRSISWFLGASPAARAWVVAGFHTGGPKMRMFFERGALAAEGLEIEAIWERDIQGVERPWVEMRGGGEDDIGGSKRWLAVGVLKRTEGYEGAVGGGV